MVPTTREGSHDVRTGDRNWARGGGECPSQRARRADCRFPPEAVPAPELFILFRAAVDDTRGSVTVFLTEVEARTMLSQLRGPTAPSPNTHHRRTRRSRPPTSCPVKLAEMLKLATPEHS